jgi:putative ABC transport system ATP-binding protein
LIIRCQGNIDTFGAGKQKYGTTMLIVSHNTAIKDMVHKVIKIKDGKICEDYINNTLIPAKDLEW